jgi:hypothetical protein
VESLLELRHHFAGRLYRFPAFGGHINLPEPNVPAARKCQPSKHYDRCGKKSVSHRAAVTQENREIIPDRPFYKFELKVSKTEMEERFFG